MLREQVGLIELYIQIKQYYGSRSFTFRKVCMGSYLVWTFFPEVNYLSFGFTHHNLCFFLKIRQCELVNLWQALSLHTVWLWSTDKCIFLYLLCSAELFEVALL